MALGSKLLSFSVEDGDRYTFIEDNTSFYYFKNETQKIALDTSAYSLCLPTALRAFNGKAYALAHCQNSGGVWSFAIWVDGQESSALQRQGDSAMTIGCDTSSGFSTKLD